MPRRKRNSVRPQTCPNCKTALTDDFCSHCGQNNRNERLDLGEMVGTAFDNILELDVPILRTFWGLTTRPGRMCREYVEGRRRHYTTPLRYAIITTALYVLVVTLSSPSEDLRDTLGIQTSPIPAASADAPANDTPGAGDTGAEGEAEGEGEGNEVDPRRAKAMRVSQYISTNAPRKIEQSMNFVALPALPIVAVALLLLFRRSGFTYAEHLSFAFFAYGHAFLIATLAVAAGSFESVAATVATQIVGICYEFWAMLTFYRDGFARTVLKLIVATICYTLATIVIATVFVTGWIAYLFLSGAMHAI